MTSIFLTQYDGAFLGPIAKVLGQILEWLADFLNVFGIQNTGLTIILFTFLVNGLMIPLTIKQNKFSKLSSKMAPELNRIQKKYKGKTDEVSMRKQQMETQAVYQKYGSSPVAGCLPMLITLPILFALYRVIYHIPAYVDIYYKLYTGGADAIIEASRANPDIFTKIFPELMSTVQLNSNLQVPIAEWANYVKLNDAASLDLVQHNLVEVMSQFNTSNWEALANAFKDNKQVMDAILSTQASVSNVSYFLGFSVIESPGFGIPGIVIPLAAAGFQFLQTKLLPTPETDPDNPTAGAMKSMNTVMPIMSGVFCAMLPIGVGLYWIAGSVFRILQQIFVNRYMDHIDVDQLIEKNVEKQNKKRAKRGLPPIKAEDISKIKTSSIDVSVEDRVKAPKKTAPTDYKRNNTNQKPSSIAGYANLLGKNNGEKGDK